MRLDGTDPGFPADFQCRGELHHHHLAQEERAWDRDRSSALLNFSFETLAISPKIVQIERYALRVAILGECQNYLGGWGRLWVFRPPPPRATCIIPDARPLGLTQKKGTLNSLNCNLYPYKFLFFMLCVISAIAF